MSCDFLNATIKIKFNKSRKVCNKKLFKFSLFINSYIRFASFKKFTVKHLQMILKLCLSSNNFRSKTRSWLVLYISSFNNNKNCDSLVMIFKYIGYFGLNLAETSFTCVKIMMDIMISNILNFILYSFLYT